MTPDETNALPDGKNAASFGHASLLRDASNPLLKDRRDLSGRCFVCIAAGLLLSGFAGGRDKCSGLREIIISFDVDDSKEWSDRSSTSDRAKCNDSAWLDFCHD